MASKKNVMKKKVLLSKTLPYIKKEFKLVLLTFILTILTACLSASTPFITKAILDTFLPDRDYDMVTKMLILYGFIVIILFIVRYLFQFVNNLTGMRIEKRIREDAMYKVNLLPVDYFSLEPDGKIVAKITSDSNGIRIFYVKMFEIFNAIINIIIVYVCVIIMEPMLGLIILGLVPILILWITIYRKWVHKYFVNTREIGSRITGKLNENISGAMIIEVFNKENDINKEYNDLTWSYVKNERKAQQLNNAFGFELLSFLKRLAEIALLMYLGFESISIGGAVLTIGLVAALVENLDKMINPFTTIFDSLNELEDAMVGATRCYLFIDEMNDTMTEEGELSPKLLGDVEFNNVSFEYVPGTPILKNFTYSAKRGMTVGIVGATGAGKSTLMNLLLRYNDYQSGSIKIDGYEIKNYNKKSYRENMGIVLQTPSLFAGTIKSNVTLERDYSDTDVRNALIQVGAEDLLLKNNNDINAPVTFKGENLSLGEKQLICFARIILRNPAILVLDEATANIDSETEEKIQNAMHVISEKRTTFIIAHRLSTIKDADEIIVMSHGDIVGVGKHNELYKTCDTYKDMYDSQFKNFKN